MALEGGFGVGRSIRSVIRREQHRTEGLGLEREIGQESRIGAGRSEWVREKGVVQEGGSGAGKRERGRKEREGQEKRPAKKEDLLHSLLPAQLHSSSNI